MKSFFEAIQSLFEDFLFLPFDILRELELESWWSANIVSWIFIVIGAVTMVYWVLQLKKFNDNGEEDKRGTAHSYL